MNQYELKLDVLEQLGRQDDAAVYARYLMSGADPEALAELTRLDKNPHFRIGDDGRLPAFQQAFDALTWTDKPKLVVELGSWLGRSACLMAREFIKTNRQAVICCVDTWLGSFEHQEKDILQDIMKPSFGYPSIYMAFMKQVVCRNVQQFIIPIPLPTSIAARKFENIRQQIDLLYVDASHDWRDVQRDLEDWSYLIAHDGVIIGDDYDWESVRDAVQSFVSTSHLWNLDILCDGRTYRLTHRD